MRTRANRRDKMKKGEILNKVGKILSTLKFNYLKDEDETSLG